MSFSIPYELSKDTYPELTIRCRNTRLDKGIHGVEILLPRNITVEVNGRLVDLSTLVKAYEDQTWQ